MIHCIIVPNAIRAASNIAAHNLGIDPEGTLNTLSVPLVPTDGPDDATPSHWGCCGKVNEPARQWLQENQDGFPGALWWRWDESDSNRLVASYDSENLGQFWDWDNCLTEAGLKPQILPIQ